MQKQDERITENEARMRFEEWLEKIKKTTISISRVPEQYKTRFMEIAKIEFANDYGMCLREMVRTWDGIYVNPNEEILIKIDIVSNEISELKKQFEEIKQIKKEQVMVMADGTVKRIG